MLQIERENDFQESLRVALEGFASENLWTALPGIVQSYNPVQGTCVIQLAIKGRIRNSAGVDSFVAIAPLPDVPVVYMGGGSFVATFPIQPGDEALVVFSARCIDSWWQNGGVQLPADRRQHDLSDGFALVGPRSLARSIPNVSTDSAQLRSLDGTVVIDLADSQITITAPTVQVNATNTATVQGETVNVTGSNQVNISGSGHTSIEGKDFLTHTHSGVAAGGGVTGPVM